MRQLLRNLLALGLGFCTGAAVSVAIQVMAGMPLQPAGDDAHHLAGRILASMAMPESAPYPAQLAAHALGTYCGAAVATWLAASHGLIVAMAIGFAFMSFGIASVLAMPLPLWFEVADLNLAYIPMAWLGWRSVGELERQAG